MDIIEILYNYSFLSLVWDNSTLLNSSCRRSLPVFSALSFHSLASSHVKHYHLCHVSLTITKPSVCHLCGVSRHKWWTFRTSRVLLFFGVCYTTKCVISLFAKTYHRLGLQLFVIKKYACYIDFLWQKKILVSSCMPCRVKPTLRKLINFVIWYNIDHWTLYSTRPLHVLSVCKWKAR